MNSNVTFHDDDFNFDPAAYAAATGARTGGQATEDGPLPAPGYYVVRVVSGGLKQNKETGELLTDKNGKPIFSINRIEVLEPEEAVGSFKLFQSIYTNGFHPKNWKTGEVYTNRPKVYEFVSCLMAIDDLAPTGNYGENIESLDKLLQSKPTMTVRLTYEGTDKALAQTLIATGVDKKAAYKQATLKSKAFKNADGTYRTQTSGVSGEAVMAELRIAEFVPSGAAADVVLGPLPLRANA
jgi:hypothetical protein